MVILFLFVCLFVCLEMYNGDTMVFCRNNEYYVNTMVSE